jgi:hypothetical protein
MACYLATDYARIAQMKIQESRPARRATMLTSWLAPIGFGDMHLIARGECLAAIDISLAYGRSKPRQGVSPPFVRRQRAHFADKSCNHLHRASRCRSGSHQVSTRRAFESASLAVVQAVYFRASARYHRADDLACFRFVVDEQTLQAVERSNSARISGCAATARASPSSGNVA